MDNIAWLVPFFPLLGFVLLGLLGTRIPKSMAAVIGSGSVLLAFLTSLSIFFGHLHHTEASIVPLMTWFKSGTLTVNFALQIDALSSIFMLVVTGVGFLIHVYSAGYMHDDEGHNRFFTYLNLFIFFMLLLVMGNNYLLMFVGWEGVGLCSYLLIGFWFKNINYSSAAKKAFIMNRIGDLGFLLGVILIFIQYGSITYTEVFEKAGMLGSSNALTLLTIFLFVGAIGKSAQIPLFTWLPDAMAGPTPVSALIHAATMVTAGIYMVARSNVLFSLAPFTMDIIAAVGLATALFAATIGVYQNDIKKVLAYSTVSQLGLMFAALGVGAYSTGVFHVVTHAFFKALLFLGAGSVIHAMSGEQDIRFMGGLKNKLPITFWTFIIGTIAIAGIPPFAGFFSKDQILAALLFKNTAWFVVALITSLLTTFYMFRLVFLTFYGDFRGTEHQKSHLHESPLSMTFPLMVLAVLSVIGGFMGFPHAIGETMGIGHWLDHYLEPVTGHVPFHFSAQTEWLMIGVTVALIAIVILIARSLFITKKQIPTADENAMSAVQKVIYNKYYIDESYQAAITAPIDFSGDVMKEAVEPKLVEGSLNSIGRTINWISRMLKFIQTGNLGWYLLVMLLSICAMIVLKIFV